MAVASQIFKKNCYDYPKVLQWPPWAITSHRPCLQYSLCPPFSDQSCFEVVLHYIITCAFSFLFPLAGNKQILRLQSSQVHSPVLLEIFASFTVWSRHLSRLSSTQLLGKNLSLEILIFNSIFQQNWC